MSSPMICVIRGRNAVSCVSWPQLSSLLVAPHVGTRIHSTHARIVLYCTCLEIFTPGDSVLRESCSLLYCSVSIGNYSFICLAIVLRFPFCDCNLFVIFLAIVLCVLLRDCDLLVIWLVIIIFSFNCNPLVFWFAIVICLCSYDSLVFWLAIEICFSSCDCNPLVFYLAVATGCHSPFAP